jgi:hypothetical protein
MLGNQKVTLKQTGLVLSGDEILVSPERETDPGPNNTSTQDNVFATLFLGGTAVMNLKNKMYSDIVECTKPHPIGRR